MRPAGWGLGLGIAVGLGLVMGFVGAPAPEVVASRDAPSSVLPARPTGPPAATPPAPADETPPPGTSRPATPPPPCDTEPDPDLLEAVAAAEAELAALQARNTAAEGPVQPWPPGAEARLPALEDTTLAALAGLGLSPVHLDCGELPCLLFLEGPRDAAGSQAEGWVGPLESALAEGGVSATTLRYGIRNWPDEAVEGVLLLVPDGVALGFDARQIAERRIDRIARDRMYEDEAALRAGAE